MDPEVHTTPVTLRRSLFLIPLVVLLISSLVALFFYFRSHKQGDFVSGFVAGPEDNLTSTNGRTNLVFLGFGGDGHEGVDLTDSMIFISLSHSTHSVSMLSIPRDIWVDSMKAKVNTAFHYGNARREGGGLDLTKSSVSEITGQPIHYALALDFTGFVTAIDAVGGIDVEVEREFDDYKYPIPGKEEAQPESDRYEHLRFNKGLTQMDGATALKFARSRYSQGEEGTDFARSKRQQKIILAFKDKLLSSQTLLNPDRLQEVVGSFRSNLDTDMKDGEFGSFFRFFTTFSNNGQRLVSLTLDDLLETPTNRSLYQGHWVLAPVTDWPTIHDYVAKNLAE